MPYTFCVNWVADKPSVSGDFVVLLNPVGDAPEYNRLLNTTAVSWSLWLGQTKALEYAAMLQEAKEMTGTSGVLHRFCIIADVEVSAKKGLKPGQQMNVLTLKSKVVREIRPIESSANHDDLA